MRKEQMVRIDFSFFEKATTDTHLAAGFADTFGSNIRFDHKRQRYLLWKDHLWQPDTTGKVYNMIAHYGKMVQTEGESINNKELTAYGIMLQNKTKMQIVYDFAKRQSPISITGDEFDTNPNLLGVKNGIVDLTTGLLRQGRQSDYISQFSPVLFDSTAKCGLWEQFLETIFEEDIELISYLQRALGYSMTGDMGEQLIFICYGEGENGKSIFFSVIDKIFGDYAKTASSNLFKKNIFNSQTNDLADLEGLRFITNAESIKGAHLDEERLKSISGGDRITARRLHQNNFSFYPQCKVWLYTNNYPKIDDDSHGMKRRLRVIQFPHQITLEERINNYDKILLQESSGILNWLIKGSLEWKQKGLRDIPASINIATEDYYEKNSPIYEYLNDRTSKDPQSTILTSIIYLDYKLYMTERRKPVESQQKFGRLMNSLHYKRVHKENGDYYISLKLQD